MSSLKKLVTLWRSDFHASTVFEAAVSSRDYLSGIQHMKCGIWWMCDNDNLFIRDCNTNINLSHSFPRHQQFSQDRLPGSMRVVFDPIQNLVVVIPFPGICIVTGAEQKNRHIFSVEFRLASSLLPHPESVGTSLKCQHSFEDSGHHRVVLTHEPAICGDRVVILYCTSATVESFIQVIDWRKGHAKSVSSLYF
jgi:hypothetical protein